MNQIPCIENKCLLYPVCRYKKFIVCTPLREYCYEVSQTHKIDNDQDIWTILYSSFPNLLGVQLDQAPKDSDITNVKDLLLNRHKIPMEMISMMSWKIKEL